MLYTSMSLKLLFILFDYYISLLNEKNIQCFNCLDIKIFNSFSGQVGDTEEITQKASQLKADNITIYSVGMGSNINYPVMVGMASNPANVFNATDLNSMESLKLFLAKAACNGNGILILRL